MYFNICLHVRVYNYKNVAVRIVHLKTHYITGFLRQYSHIMDSESQTLTAPKSWFGTKKA